MIKNIFLPFILLSSITIYAQTATHISRKGVYQLQYNTKNWVKNEIPRSWDAEFHDTYNLLNAFFIEYDYFIPDKKVTKLIKDEFSGLGKVKNLKVYPKQINGLDVNYFECDLKYELGVCKYEGFIYNGKGGAMQIIFSYQAEAPTQFKELITEFYTGLSVLQ